MKLGLVCISEILKDGGVAFQTMTRSNFLKKEKAESLKLLSQRILHNAQVVQKILEHCASSSIWHYRVSSNMFPLLTDPQLCLCVEDLPDWLQIKKAMWVAGELADELGVSLSSHPDQYNVLASTNPDVVRRTIIELNFQSFVLDLLGCSQDLSSPMCLHVSSSPKNETPQDYALRFMKNLSECSAGVQSRLCLENEDKAFWTAANLLQFFPQMPLIFDNLHNRCNPCGLLEQEIIDLFRKTWNGHTPVFHLSEGKDDKPRSHTDYFSYLPDCVSNNYDCVWECEVKAKDRAIIKILQQTY